MNKVALVLERARTRVTTHSGGDNIINISELCLAANGLVQLGEKINNFLSTCFLFDAISSTTTWWQYKHDLQGVVYFNSFALVWDHSDRKREKSSVTTKAFYMTGTKCCVYILWR